MNRNHINTDTKKNCKNSWANQYLFDYTNIDEQRIKELFHL